MDVVSSSQPDQPHPAVVVGVAVAGLLAGLGLAGLAASPGAPRMAAEAPVETFGEPIAAVDPVPAAEATPAEAEPFSPSEPSPMTVPTPAEASPEPPPAAAIARSWTRVVRGRVAYLRCEAPALPPPEGTPTAGTCVRDAALEAAVWAAVEALGECATAPPSPGELDLVVEAAPSAPLEARARDRFAPDVVRMDSGAVLGCVVPALTASAPVVQSPVVVSFRFRTE